MAEIIFYKARQGKIIPDYLIGLRTMSRYSHVELRFSETDIFSASWFDGRGVRWRDDYELLPEKWDRYAIIAPLNMVESMQRWCMAMHKSRQLSLESGGNRHAYDLLSVLLWNRNVDNFEKWFCSEVCFAAMKRVGIVPQLKRFRKISPGSGEQYCSHHQHEQGTKATFAHISAETKYPIQYFTDQEGDELWRQYNA